MIYVLGDINVDVVAVHQLPIADGSDTAASISLQPGGSGGNVAAWLGRAGIEVTLIGRVGEDALADVALSGLDGVHLHVTRDPERPTGTCVVLVAPGGERTMLPTPAPTTGWSRPTCRSSKAASCTSPATRSCGPAAAPPRWPRSSAPATPG